MNIKKDKVSVLNMLVDKEKMDSEQMKRVSIASHAIEKLN